LEVAGIDGNNANGIMVIWAQIFDGYGCLLGRNVSDYMK